MDPYLANLQPSLLLLGSRLRFNPTPTFLGVTFNRTLSFSKHVSSLKAKFCPCLKALRCISASSLGASKESLSLPHKAFVRLLLTYASPGWFSFLSVTSITKLERLHWAVNCSSPATSRPPLSHILSPRLLYFPYESPWLISLCHLTSGLFVSQPPFSFQVWPDLEQNQDSADRPGELFRPLTRSYFLLFLLERLYLLALPLLIGTCLLSPWSPPFPLHAPALIPFSLSPRYGTRPPWLSPTLPSGARDRRFFFFFFWQKRLWRPCQLLSLWLWGYFFLFSGPNMLKFFRWSLRHSARSCWSLQHQ